MKLEGGRESTFTLFTKGVYLYDETKSTKCFVPHVSHLLLAGVGLSRHLGSCCHENSIINTATIEQLETVNGVGQDTAQNILDYKKEHGKFTSMEELETVKGVGKVRLQALNEAFTVESTKKNH